MMVYYQWSTDWCCSHTCASVHQAV